MAASRRAAGGEVCIVDVEAARAGSSRLQGGGKQPCYGNSNTEAGEIGYNLSAWG